MDRKVLLTKELQTDEGGEGLSEGLERKLAKIWTVSYNDLVKAPAVKGKRKRKIQANNHAIKLLANW